MPRRLLHFVLLVIGLVLPTIASAAAATEAETRVWGFDLIATTLVGPSSPRSLEKRLENPDAYDELASGSPLAAKAGAMAGRRLGHTFTKHGAENTAQLLKEAAGSGKAVGQWLDNAAAEKFIAQHVDELKNGARTFDLPEGLGRVVNPDGTFSAATKARLVPSGSGVKTAYPLAE
jgi:hypothetical protein